MSLLDERQKELEQELAGVGEQKAAVARKAAATGAHESAMAEVAAGKSVGIHFMRAWHSGSETSHRLRFVVVDDSRGATLDVLISDFAEATLAEKGVTDMPGWAKEQLEATLAGLPNNSDLLAGIVEARHDQLLEPG